jgi:hypothetical protein
VPAATRRARRDKFERLSQRGCPPCTSIQGGRVIGIFDIFTGDPARRAAADSRALLTRTRDDITSRTLGSKDEAAGYLDRGFDAARGNYAGYNATAGDAVNRGAGNAFGHVDFGTSGARDALGHARRDLAEGYRPLTDLAADFRIGSKLYADAMGLNGAEGRARAEQSFKTGPGYRFTFDQGIDALNRSRNARGALNSGGTDLDALKFGTGLADQTWQSWLAGLSPYNQFSLSSASGVADSGKSLANLGLTEANLLDSAGRTKASIAQGQGNTLADIANRYYLGLAGLDTSEGSALAGNATHAANAINAADLNIAPQIGQTYKDEAAAAMAGSKAFWDALMGGANLALKASGVGGFGRPAFGGSGST